MYLKAPTDSLLKCLSSRPPCPCALLWSLSSLPLPPPWLILPPPLCRVVDVQYLIANDGTDHTMAQLTLSLSDDASVLKASQAALSHSMLSCLPARLPACSPSGLLTLMPNLTPGLSVCPPAPICLPACLPAPAGYLLARGGAPAGGWPRRVCCPPQPLPGLMHCQVLGGRRAVPGAPECCAAHVLMCPCCVVWCWEVGGQWEVLWEVLRCTDTWHRADRV